MPDDTAETIQWGPKRTMKYINIDIDISPPAATPPDPDPAATPPGPYQGLGHGHAQIPKGYILLPPSSLPLPMQFVPPANIGAAPFPQKAPGTSGDDVSKDCFEDPIDTHYAGFKLIETYSKKDTGWIIVMATPFAVPLAVIDCDAPGMAPSKLIGYSVTPRGRHYYVGVDSPALSDPRWQDMTYLQLAMKRQFYGERLFNPDGTPRPLPVVLEQFHWMISHAQAWARFQKEAVKLHLEKPREEPLKPRSTVVASASP